MHKEKHTIIFPLVSIVLMLGGIVLPLLFFQSIQRGPGTQGHMYFPFLLACVLGLSVMTKSFHQTRQLKSWNLTYVLTSATVIVLAILLFGLITANIFELMQALK